MPRRGMMMLNCAVMLIDDCDYRLAMRERYAISKHMT